MIHAAIDNSFDGWRDRARRLIAMRVRPEDVVWSDAEQIGLFATEAGEATLRVSAIVPAEFVKLATLAACFDDADRWRLMYAILFRLVYENRNLMAIESDADIRRLNLMAKAVRRDIHKFHAFVRFRRVEREGKEIFVAWHEPHHFTVELATPFFSRRFGSMLFSILTPKGCAHWDFESLTFSAAATRDLAPSPDQEEDFWLLYYRTIFNPFRLKVRAMKRELPVRHWPTLPEAALIPELIREARDNRETGSN